MKYKAGDMIEIKSLEEILETLVPHRINSTCTGLHFVDGMDKHCGKLLRVDAISDSSYDGKPLYHAGFWWWRPEWINDHDEDVGIESLFD